MFSKYWLIFLTSSLFFFITPPVLSMEFSSSIEATELIELYTSEGCSSCPPADKWLMKLKSSPKLFNQFIPLSFHVDYWNQLGWKDRFSSSQYTNRQYQHHRVGNISQVYTPAFVINNQEWRNWRVSGYFDWPDSQKKIGILKANYQQGQPQLSVSFAPLLNIEDKYLTINIAILGMGLKSNVSLGENRGRTLAHDFVVLTHNQQQLSISKSKIQQWKIDAPKIPNKGQQKNVLVVWLSTPNSQHVIQATGGFL